MTYIKINKDSLDYHQYANFHAFTMNNFIRSIMRNGKYKKATKLARLGLRFGLKRIHYWIKYNRPFGVFKTYRKSPATTLSENTQTELNLQLPEAKAELKLNRPFIKGSIKASMKDAMLENAYTTYYANLTNKLSLNKEKNPVNFSFFKYYNKIIKKSAFEKDFKKKFKQEISAKYDTTEEPLTQLQFQHHLLSQRLKFKKIYTKKPQMWFFRTRNLTVFDMIIQVYTMLTGIWYMRKIKVSGRTVLVPSPLRPYRRITTVTKMLFKGIRQFRKTERYQKKAMIYSIGMEFFYLVFHYGWQYKHPNITASYVWQLKLQSHKELVANLKNLKHANHY